MELFRRSSDPWSKDLVNFDPFDNSFVAFAKLPEPDKQESLEDIQRGRPIWTVVSDHVVTMWTFDPLVHVYRDSGDLERTIKLPLKRRSLTERDIAAQVQRYGAIASGLSPGPAALTNMPYPVNDSVFGMLISELWRTADDPEIPDGARYMRLFSVNGTYLGFVRPPETFRFIGAGKGTIWARVLDENAEPVIEELTLVRHQAPDGAVY